MTRFASARNFGYSPVNPTGGAYGYQLNRKAALRAAYSISQLLRTVRQPFAPTSGLVSFEAGRLCIAADCPHLNSTLGSSQIKVSLKQQTVFKRPVYLELTF